MLCQNCGKNDAVIHLRRIINGETAELHLCSDCGAAMGYSIGFSRFGLGPGGIFGGMFSELLSGGTGVRNSVCEKCGCSFDDIVRNGRVGCDECYNFFSDKLSVTLENIFGSAVYCGKYPENGNSRNFDGGIIDELKMRLKYAVDIQDFETAAKLRDEIKLREKYSDEMV